MRSEIAARRARARVAGERGMTTAEYAVGTVAVVTGVGVLIAVLADPSAPIRILWPLIQQLIGVVLRLFGAR